MQGSEWWIGQSGSESLPDETMTHGEETSRHTIDTILEGALLSRALSRLWVTTVPSGGPYSFPDRVAW